MSAKIENQTDLDKIEKYHQVYKQEFARVMDNILFKIFELKKTVKVGIISIETAFNIASMYSMEQNNQLINIMNQVDMDLFGEYIDNTPDDN